MKKYTEDDFNDVWLFNRSMMARHGVCLTRKAVERLLREGNTIEECKEYIHGEVKKA